MMKPKLQNVEKEIRAMTRAYKRVKIANIWSDFKVLGRIADIRQNGHRCMLTSVRDNTGSLQTSRQGIVHAFTAFYEKLYTGRHDGQIADDDVHMDADVDPITSEEVRKQLDLMKKGKAADSNGVVVEMLKAAGEALVALIADLYNDVLHPNAQVPEEWRTTRLSVLFTKGDSQMLDNYRPISLIPILLKLFSRVLYARMETKLSRNQACDRAGFRS